MSMFNAEGIARAKEAMEKGLSKSSEFKNLPDGIYEVVIISVEPIEVDEMNAKIKWHFKVCEGIQGGKSVWKFHNLSGDPSKLFSYDYLGKDLLKFDFNIEALENIPKTCMELEGRSAEIKIEMKNGYSQVHIMKELPTPGQSNELPF